MGGGGRDAAAHEARAAGRPVLPAPRRREGSHTHAPEVRRGRVQEGRRLFPGGYDRQRVRVGSVAGPRACARPRARAGDRARAHLHQLHPHALRAGDPPFRHAEGCADGEGPAGRLGAERIRRLRAGTRGGCVRRGVEGPPAGRHPPRHRFRPHRALPPRAVRGRIGADVRRHDATRLRAHPTSCACWRARTTAWRCSSRSTPPGSTRA